MLEFDLSVCGVAFVAEKPGEHNVHAEGRGSVGLGGRREIVAQGSLGEPRLAVDLVESGCGVHERGVMGVIESDGVVKCVGGFIVPRTARVESAEVGPCIGLVSDGSCGAELPLCSCVVLLFFGGHGASAVRALRKPRRGAVGEQRGLFESPTND